MFAVITGFNMTCSVGEVVSADISWTGHGAPVELGSVSDCLFLVMMVCWNLSGHLPRQFKPLLASVT